MALASLAIICDEGLFDGQQTLCGARSFMPGCQQGSKLLILVFTSLSDAVRQQAKSGGQVGNLIAAQEIAAGPIDVPAVFGIQPGRVRQRHRLLLFWMRLEIAGEA